MSLVGTLGKVALGAIAARGIGKMMSGSSSGGGAMGGLLGSLLGGSGGGSALSGLLGGGSSAGNALSGLLGGGQQQQGGGLGGLLAGLTGQQQSGGSSAGGLGGLLDALGGGTSQQSGGIGALLNQALAGTPADEIQATADQEKEAELMLRAMIAAAKADGEIDAEEQRKLTEHLGDVSPEEAEIVRREMQSQTSLEDLVRSVPKGLEQQVYLMSLLAIDLDSQAEAQYLDKLANGLGISHQQANAIHQQLGVPTLYG
jgi:uncharacterized membrane protein YebE (DUF533 family)